MRTCETRTLVLLATLAVAAARPVAAQTPFMGGTLYREYDLGMRSFLDRPADTALMYFERYRDMRQGVVVPDGRLWYVSENRQQLVEFRVARAGQNDQAFGLLAERLGRYRLRLDISELPHVYSTNAKLVRDAAGGFTLPDPRPDTSAWNQCSARADGTVPAECAGLLAGRFAMKTARAGAQLSFVPAPFWMVAAEYDRTTRSGHKPMGMIMGSSPGHPARDIMEPVDHTIARFRIAPSLIRPLVRLQASYEYTSFGNANATVTADNPASATNTATAGSASGRSALAPDNQAHTFGLTGGVDAGALRLSGAMSYGMRLQNAAFVPFTINSAIDTTALERDRASLQGEVRTFVAQLSANLRLAPGWSLGARLRHFGLDDRTPHYEQRGRVVGDRSLNTALWEREAYSHTRQNASADLRWRHGTLLGVQLSSALDVWHRNTHVRERGRTSEFTPRLTVDLAPVGWASMRAAVSKGWRTGSEYGQVALAQFSEARKYDMASRDRERVDLTADLDLAGLASSLSLPDIGALGLGLLYGRSRTDYPKTQYGVQFDHNDAFGATLDFAPLSRLTFTAGYLYERWNAQMGSRYRAPPANLDNTSYDWISTSREELRTLSLGATVVVIPRRLEVSLWWDSTGGRTEVGTYNPRTPTPATNSARADSFPPMTYRMEPWSAVVRLDVSRSMTVSARYSQERFAQSDFRTDGLAPATAGSYYLGADPVGYLARYFTVTFAYRPWIPGRRRADS